MDWAILLWLCLRGACELVEKWLGRGEFSGEGGVVRVARVAFEASLGLGAMLFSLGMMLDLPKPS